MVIQTISLNAYNFYLPLLAIVCLCAALVVAFDCAWRVERRLKTFMRLLAAAVGLMLAKKVLEIAGFTAGSFLNNFFAYLDIAVSIFLLCAMVEMYKIIRRLDGENPPKNS